MSFLGSLTKALEQAVQYLDDSAEMTRKLKSILVPNIVQFVVLLLLLIVGTLVAIPAIESVFEQVGSEDQLPETTLWFKGVLQWLMAYWYIPTSIIAVIALAIVIYIKTPQGKYNFHYFKYKMPVFGSLIYAIDFSRLIKALLLNIRNRNENTRCYGN